MAIGIDYVTLINKRAVGLELIVSDFFDIPGPPAAGIVGYRMIEIPLNVITPPSVIDPIFVREVDPVTHVPTGPILTLVTDPTVPIAGQFQIDTTTGGTFDFGTIIFSQLDGAKTMEIIYTGRGSLIFASDVNDPRDEQKAARDTEVDLGARLGLIEDGTRIQDEAIRARHITTTVEAFDFPGDVNIAGDMNIVGVINKSISEVITSSDNFLLLNSDHTGAPTLDSGLQIERGSSTDAELRWNETDDIWETLAGGLRVAGGNLEMEQNQMLKGVIHNVADQTAENTLASEPALDGQVIFRTDSKKLRVYNATATAFQNAGLTITREDQTAGPVQTVFNLGSITFTPGDGSLFVYANGILQRLGGLFDYTETGASQITFVAPVLSSANMSFIHFGV